MQPILENTINIISDSVHTTESDSYLQNLPQTACIQPFYSPNNRYIAYWCVTEPEYGQRFGYRLYVKDLYTDRTYNIIENLSSEANRNGFHPFIENTFSNRFKYSAAFSPNSRHILFLTSAKDFYLFGDSEESGSVVNDEEYRWAVYTFGTRSLRRVAVAPGAIYGNSFDAPEALWLDNDRIVFVTYSDNLSPGIISSPGHSEVYIRNITNNTTTHVSRRETGNPFPYFTGSSYNISVSGNKVTFYNQDTGFAIKDTISTSLTRVQDLPGISAHGIVQANIFSWSNDGTKALFRIGADNITIPQDNNDFADDFVYDFTNDTIIPINDNSTGLIYGDGYSISSLFSPDGTKVAFLSDSQNISIFNNENQVGLFIKDLETGILTQVSRSWTHDDEVNSDILGFNWLSNNRIVFTSTATNLVDLDAPHPFNNIDWFITDLDTDYNVRINFNGSQQQFSVIDILTYANSELEWLFPGSSDIVKAQTNHDDNNLYTLNNEYIKNIRREQFNNAGNTVLFSAKLNDLDPQFLMPGVDGYNIFSKVFEDTTLDMPTAGTIYPTPNDAINATVKNEFLADAYRVADGISNDPTFSIIGSQYVERQHTNRYKINEDSPHRWMRISYPVIPNTAPSIRIGAGIFKATPTLLDDIIDVHINGSITPINPVLGTLLSFDVEPYRDIVLVTAGPDQSNIEGDIPFVYLQAEYYGNPNDHTFTWEQIFGETVDLVQTSDTEAYYPNTGSTETRIFRFWIDRDASADGPTAYNGRQYQDVAIFNSPMVQALILRTDLELVYANGKYIRVNPGPMVTTPKNIDVISTININTVNGVVVEFEYVSPEEIINENIVSDIEDIFLESREVDSVVNENIVSDDSVIFML